jgi:hypothetical protein
MKKLAIFLEGQTERLFVEELIHYCAGKSNIIIQSKRGNLGRKYQRIFFEVNATKIGTGDDFFILVIDSGSDGSVTSDIKELYNNLIDEKYSLIVGLRDVRPSFLRQDIDKLRRGLASSMHIKELPVELHLAVMEVEAWFLAENTHFKKFDRRLTRAKIIKALGFFPDDDNAEARENPSADLGIIHGIIGNNYDKSHAVVRKIVNALNYQNLVFRHSIKIEDLGGLVNGLNAFFQVGKPGVMS